MCFPKAPKSKSIFGKTFQSLDPFLKSQSMTENVLQIQEFSGQAAQSCKPFQDYHSDSEWLEHCWLFHRCGPWVKSLGLLIGFYSHVIQTMCLVLAQRDISKANLNTPFQHISDGSSGRQLYRAGRLSGRYCILAT